LWADGVPHANDFKPRADLASLPPVFLRSVTAPDLHVFTPAKPNGAAVLVIPGGGYTFVSIDNEGVQIARRLTARGYHVFVLTYRLPSEGWRNRADVPLQDAQRAVRVIRSLAARYGIDPSKIAAIGFSAGGHLAATLATDVSELPRKRDKIDSLSARPAAVGLIYPVISMSDRYTHAISRTALLGEGPTPDLIARRSPDQHVGADTPPIFLAHAVDDSRVPVDNSLLMLAALRIAKRPTEAHLFQEGEHAFAAGYPGTPSSLWIDALVLWLDRLGIGAARQSG
jgi:acetyl esterase/lipase